MLRDALFEARLKEAAMHAVKGAAEIAGLKERTGAAEEAEQKRWQLPAFARWGRKE